MRYIKWPSVEGLDGYGIGLGTDRGASVVFPGLDPIYTVCVILLLSHRDCSLGLEQDIRGQCANSIVINVNNYHKLKQKYDKT